MLFKASVLALLVSSITFACASPIVGRKECPVYKLLVKDDPYEATALPGYYLYSANNTAVLVDYRPGVTTTYSSNGPLGLWGSGPTTDGCEGYSYLNAHPTVQPSYSALTWDAVSVTQWNATAGLNLTKLGYPVSSSFIACKRPTSSKKIGTYVLLLADPIIISLASSTITSADGDTLTRSSCIPTKIRIVPTTSA